MVFTSSVNIQVDRENIQSVDLALRKQGKKIPRRTRSIQEMTFKLLAKAKPGENLTLIAIFTESLDALMFTR